MKTIITIEQVSAEIDLLFDNYQWYIGNEIEKGRKRIVVFVENMGKEVSSLVPDNLYGYQVLMAFQAYKDCGKKYGVVHRDLGVSLDIDRLIADY